MELILNSIIPSFTLWPFSSPKLTTICLTQLFLLPPSASNLNSDNQTCQFASLCVDCENSTRGNSIPTCECEYLFSPTPIRIDQFVSSSPNKFPQKNQNHPKPNPSKKEATNLCNSSTNECKSIQNSLYFLLWWLKLIIVIFLLSFCLIHSAMG